MSTLPRAPIGLSSTELNFTDGEKIDNAIGL
jgi:hypothetical protein